MPPEASAPKRQQLQQTCRRHVERQRQCLEVQNIKSALCKLQSVNVGMRVAKQLGESPLREFAFGTQRR